MKYTHYYPSFLFTLLFVALLSGSCAREFNDNDDYQYDRIEPVLGDNTLLYSKVFRNQSVGTYLWFDLRNEIASFSKPTLSISFLQNGIERNKLTDLRGRLYEYNQEAEEVTIFNVQIDLFGKGEQAADLVCTLARKQKDGCDDLVDEEKKEQCRRTYVLSLKRVVIGEIDATLTLGVPYSYLNSSVTLTQQSVQELLLTN